MSKELEYRLIRSSRKTLCVEIKGGELIVRAPRRATNGEIQRFLREKDTWIRTHLEKAKARQAEAAAIPRLSKEEIRALADRARDVIPQRVAHYAPLVGVTYGRITIRNQRTRWGSCSGKGI